MVTPSSRSPRILVIRRDNIGDLICTTPLLRAIRARYPDGYLAVLVSSYNVDVLAGNPDVDDIFVFLKRQQKSHGHGLLSTLWQRWRLHRLLRRMKFDFIVLANGGWRYAKTLGGKKTIGFRERDNADNQQPDVVVPLINSMALHEVEKLAALGQAIDVPNSTGPLKIYPDSEALSRQSNRLAKLGFDPARPTIGFHISSRRPQQRWPEAAFIECIRKLSNGNPKQQFLLFWSPGDEHDPMHPGDDAKAARIQAACADIPLFPCPTTQVKELIAAMSLADKVVCSDGGALHVAAALNKPIVCFFGDSIAAEWHPWGVPYKLLQPASKKVAEIDVNEVLGAINQLAEDATLSANSL